MKDLKSHYRSVDAPWDKVGACPPLMDTAEPHGVDPWYEEPVLLTVCGSARDVQFVSENRVSAMEEGMGGTAVSNASAFYETKMECFRISRLVVVFSRLIVGCVLAISSEALSNEEFACPEGNFGRTRVFAGKGPDKKPDGWKLLVKKAGEFHSDFDGFIVYGDKILSCYDRSLIAANLKGERLWQADIAVTNRRYPISPCPLHQVLGWQDKVIVVSIDGSAKAFALDDGRLLWSAPRWELKEEMRTAGNNREHELLPFAVVYKNGLHVAGERSIRRLGLEDGKELKAFEFLEKEDKWAFFTSPLVASGSTLFFSARIEASDTCHTHAIDLESGKLLWKQERTGGYEKNKDKILVAGRQVVQVINNFGPDYGPSVVGYDFATGARLPMNKIKSTRGAGSVLHQGALFFSQANELSKMDVLSGKKLWRYRSRENMEPVLAMGGSVIYARDSEGGMHAINESDGSPLWIFEAENEHWAYSIIPSNGALFRLSGRGVEVLGSPVETEPAPGVVGAMTSDPATMRKEIEDIDRQIGGLQKEWNERKRLLAEITASGVVTDESKEQSVAASRRVREIAEEVPKLKARRAELEKRLK